MDKIEDGSMSPREKRAYIAGQGSVRPLTRTKIREWEPEERAAFVAARAAAMCFRLAGSTPEFMGREEAVAAHLTGAHMAPYSNDGGALWEEEMRKAKASPDELDIADQFPDQDGQ
jgi:hypothetical protein